MGKQGNLFLLHDHIPHIKSLNQKVPSCMLFSFLCHISISLQDNHSNFYICVLNICRDGRYNVQRPSPLPADEQHRMQQHNQTLSSRNIQQSNLSIPGNISGNNRARMLSNGNGMGMSSAMNRNIPMSRPGFQGLAASSALNPNNMLSSGMVGVPSPVNMHSGSSSAQGTSMLRPREGMHVVRVSCFIKHVPEHQFLLVISLMLPLLWFCLDGLF